MTKSEKLSNAPWHTLTDDERRAWDEHAEKNAAAMFGGAKPTGQEYHRIINEWRARQEAKVKHTY